MSNFFCLAGVAQGYAAARPFFHTKVVDSMFRRLGVDALDRVLDIGCGTGLSTRALAGRARMNVGIDLSLAMLTLAWRGDGISYVAAVAETLPFADGAFDAITAAGAIDWVDREQFLPEARRVLKPGGWLLIYDIGETGEMEDEPRFAHWHREMLADFPRPPRRDVNVTAEEAARHGFKWLARERYELGLPFSADGYIAFSETQSNIVVARERGAPVGARLDSVREMFGGERRVRFAGYMHFLVVGP